MASCPKKRDSKVEPWLFFLLPRSIAPWDSTGFRSSLDSRFMREAAGVGGSVNRPHPLDEKLVCFKQGVEHPRGNLGLPREKGASRRVRTSLHFLERRVSSMPTLERSPTIVWYRARNTHGADPPFRVFGMHSSMYCCGVGVLSRTRFGVGSRTLLFLGGG